MVRMQRQTLGLARCVERKIFVNQPFSQTAHDQQRHNECEDRREEYRRRPQKNRIGQQLHSSPQYQRRNRLPKKNATMAILPRNTSMNDSKCEETSELTGSEINPGSICDAKSFTGTMRLNRSPTTSPDSVILSGRRWVSASVKISPSSRKPKAQYFSVARVSPKCA